MSEPQQEVHYKVAPVRLGDIPVAQMTPAQKAAYDGVMAGPRKHMVERFTLTEDRTRLRYEVTVEDPDFLTAPATMTPRP